MNIDAQKHLSEIFGYGSIAFRDRASIVNS
jgi:hypothetical protein